VPLEASSSFRRTGLRDDRRRRLLADDLSEADHTPLCRTWPEDGATQPGATHYGNAEFLERQWQLLDLVPRRLLVLTLLLLAAAAIIAGLEAVYAWTVERAAAGAAVAAALDVAAKGSLACWFSSLMLLAASVAALLVYTVRRHRTDDYHGRYRIWLWAAACWFLLATDQAASLREGFSSVMIRWVGTPLWRDGALWWIAIYVLLFGAIGSRLLLDMRPSRLSIAALTAALLGYGLALACHLGWRPIGTAIGEVMLRTGSEMAGHLMLLTAMGLHARYVLRDAQGLVPHPEPQNREESGKDEPEETETVKVHPADANRWRAVDPPHPAPSPTYQRPAPAVVAPAAKPVAPPAAKPVASLASTPSPVNSKLTKAERKAMKERLLHERAEREKRKW
jgi:hypothetical protein